MQNPPAKLSNVHYQSRALCTARDDGRQKHQFLPQKMENGIQSSSLYRREFKQNVLLH